MTDLVVPTGVAGTITIVLLVVLGIFVYPWLLKKRFGGAVVAAATALLALMFYQFDRGHGASAATSAALGVLWAAAPAVAGLIVARIQRKTA
jgi:glucan phosphoethanolaminetransferase (alkaline phosphatase superfamily)